MLRTSMIVEVLCRVAFFSFSCAHSISNGMYPHVLHVVLLGGCYSTFFPSHERVIRTEACNRGTRQSELKFNVPIFYARKSFPARVTMRPTDDSFKHFQHYNQWW